jgi:ribonuclease P protein component
VVHLAQPGSATDPHASSGQTPPPRAGFVVSKAVGPAVVRNRVKRRLRHLVRDRLAGLPDGSLVVVRALPPAADAEYADLASDLDAALGRLLGRSKETGAARRPPGDTAARTGAQPGARP